MKTLIKLQFGSEDVLAGWVCRIQAACAKEAKSTLELARLMCAARRALPHGGWSKLWRNRDLAIPFKKRKGEMLVAIGKGVEGLNANNCAHLPAAWHTLYYLARLGAGTLKQLIEQGRIHPGTTMKEAKELLAEYLPESRLTHPRSKIQVRLARFRAYIQANLGNWSQEEREMVAGELANMAAEIQVMVGGDARAREQIPMTANLPGADDQVPSRIVSLIGKSNQLDSIHQAL